LAKELSLNIASNNTIEDLKMNFGEIKNELASAN
jgi:hypothetical protein